MESLTVVARFTRFSDVFNIEGLNMLYPEVAIIEPIKQTLNSDSQLTLCNESQGASTDA
ncbi:hypothetical protein FM038_25355 [Shewanella eurypsychrophilus]|uniref:Uncharacterized protein n=1 Tax=Shewanella eurypsychrophilus TaxID=2593656 RepID=A0ABX8S5L7_9GAMM|nr:MULTISPECIES: hypothetical protein [Shewanella]QXP44988.1 hypothetical protein FM038_25355 [Shewanella eurypsychrophilus]